MMYCQPNLASFAAIASVFALTSSSRTAGPNESQLFHPIGGVGASILSGELSGLQNAVVVQMVNAMMLCESARREKVIRQILLQSVGTVYGRCCISYKLSFTLFQ
jgi:hypothetical protein